MRKIQGGDRALSQKLRVPFCCFPPKVPDLAGFFGQVASCLTEIEQSVRRAGGRPPARQPDAPCQPPREAACDGASHATAPPPPPTGRAPWQIPTPRHLMRNPWCEKPGAKNPGPKSWCEKPGLKVFPDFWDNGSKPWPNFGTFVKKRTFCEETETP